MSDDTDKFHDFIAWLKEDDDRSRPYRAERLQLLLQEYGDDLNIRLFTGGPTSALVFEEARLAYLNGIFLGCILLCQSCFEHMIAGVFRLSGRDDLDRAGFKELLRESRKERYISEEEFALFDRLREIRNPYAHPRAPTGEGSVLHRSVNSGVPFEDLVVHDAELAITALLRLCRRPPFAL